MPERLEGLNVEDFAHPDDLAAIRALRSMPAVDKLVSAVEDASSQLVVRMNTLGDCVRITKRSCPKIYGAVEDVCAILCCNRIPEIYIKRAFSTDVEPSGTDRPVIVIPNFVTENFDDSLLFFTIGRAVSRLKSGQLQFYVAADVLIYASDAIPFVSDAVKLSMANWMRKSELTADRGGLLACQNFQTAMRFLMCKAGMPLRFTRDVKITDYIEACRTQSRLVDAGKSIKTLTNCKGWANDRIKEMFTWYAEGSYGDLMDKYLA